MDSIDNISLKIESFYLDSKDMPDLETRLSEFLFSEIVNDLIDRNIHSFHDWLRYYSNDFKEITTLIEGYYENALKRNYEDISFTEKILIYNAIALYSIEMNVEKPVGLLANEVIHTFIEIIRHYDLFLKGYLSVDGEILISNRNKCRFYSLWETSTMKKEIPITLFNS